MVTTYYDDLLAVEEKDVSSRNFSTLVDAEEEVRLLRRLSLTGKGKSICEDEDHHFPKHPNLDLHGGASTSSSSSLLPDFQWLDLKNPQNPRCFRPLRVTAESEMRNPNSQTERRAVQERDRSPPVSSRRGRNTPESILRIMRDMNVIGQEPKLIFERILYKTDVNPSQGRLSMPIRQVIRDDFLTHGEAQILRPDINNNNKTGVDAFLVNEQSQRWDVTLKRWESKTSWNYSLTCGWNDFVAANGLDEGVGISVWTFRWYGLLCFAIVPVPTVGQIY